jgi:hypothetical protein
VSSRARTVQPEDAGAGRTGVGSSGLVGRDGLGQQGTAALDGRVGLGHQLGGPVDRFRV